MMNYRAALWQGNIEVASVSGKPEDVEREIAHYVLMYGPDGPVVIRRSRALIRWLKTRVNMD
jgi:hypothetical protein